MAAVLLRNRITAVWATLVAATLLSWWLGAGHGIDSHRMASVLILVVAFAKVCMVGMYFMELRRAPAVLRGVFQGYCVVACLVLAGMVTLL